MAGGQRAEACARPSLAELTIVLACFAAAAEAFAPAPMLGSRSASKMALSKMAPKMSLETSVVEQVGQTLAGVVAIDGGTVGLEVNFGAFLAVILGLFVPVVFLVTLYVQSEANGTATSFRYPDSTGGGFFDPNDPGLGK